MYFCHCKQINPSISVKKSSAIISQASPKKQIIVIKSLFLQFDFFASFNASLKDRIVKHTFRELATGCTCPSDFPICVCGNKPKVKIITNHPITATEEELKLNRRSSSAKLRVIEKL